MVACGGRRGLAEAVGTGGAVETGGADAPDGIPPGLAGDRQGIADRLTLSRMSLSLS
jgi:hypothetical protein